MGTPALMCIDADPGDACIRLAAYKSVNEEMTMTMFRKFRFEVKSVTKMVLKYCEHFIQDLRLHPPNLG